MAALFSLDDLYDMRVCTYSLSPLALSTPLDDIYIRLPLVICTTNAELLFVLGILS